MDETSPCRKCKSVIPIDAVRCSSCGYEPSRLELRELIILIASIFLAYILVSIGLVAIVSTFTAIGPVELTIAIGGALAIALTIGWLKYRRMTTPRFPARAL